MWHVMRKARPAGGPPYVGSVRHGADRRGIEWRIARGGKISRTPKYAPPVSRDMPRAFGLLRIMRIGCRCVAAAAARAGTSLLQFLRDDFVALTRCKFKGHAASGRVLDGLEEGRRAVSRCERCRYPIWVWVDPEDPKYYLAREVE